LLRSFPLLVVIDTLSLSHILAYAPAIVRIDASIKEKALAKSFFAEVFILLVTPRVKFFAKNFFSLSCQQLDNASSHSHQLTQLGS
ncbi:hypothetical protein, partial [Legionella donaldsonii]|uniref:hypothetical protein n=1 Tax=Legionella donaldsonii TaxID=45060 RepID=UPI00399C533A